MKAILLLLLLTASVLSVSLLWSAGQASPEVPSHLRSATELVLPAPVGHDPRIQVAANFDDGPTPVPPQLHPYDAVGRIQNAGRTRSGSGFLIGPCTVLTAYHVLFPPGETPSKKTEFTFGLGHGGSREFDLILKAKPVFWGNFSYQEDTPTEDFAVLHVPSCPGRTFSPVPLAAMSLADIALAGGRLRNAGYPVGHSMGRVWADGDCTAGGAHPLEPRLFAINCDVTPGMSGGPVLAQIDGKLLAVAIISSVVSDSGLTGAYSTVTGTAATEIQRYNMALPVASFLARLDMMGLVGQ